MRTLKIDFSCSLFLKKVFNLKIVYHYATQKRNLHRKRSEAIV